MRRDGYGAAEGGAEDVAPAAASRVSFATKCGVCGTALLLLAFSSRANSMWRDDGVSSLAELQQQQQQLQAQSQAQAQQQHAQQAAAAAPRNDAEEAAAAADAVVSATSYAAAEVLRARSGGERLRVSNEYGELATHTLEVYQLDFLIEPHRASVFRVTNSSVGDGAADLTAAAEAEVEWTLWQLETSSSSSSASSAAEDAASSSGPSRVLLAREVGATITHTCTTVGSLELTWAASGSSASAPSSSGASSSAAATTTVRRGACRYVRREIRDLTAADRDAYTAALRIVHSLDEDVGQARFGSRFTSAKRLAALHNAQSFCYHFGCVFFTSHPAFQLVLERSLQAGRRRRDGAARNECGRIASPLATTEEPSKQTPYCSLQTGRRRDGASRKQGGRSAPLLTTTTE